MSQTGVLGLRGVRIGHLDSGGCGRCARYEPPRKWAAEGVVLPDCRDQALPLSVAQRAETEIQFVGSTRPKSIQFCVGGEV